MFLGIKEERLGEREREREMWNGASVVDQETEIGIIEERKIR